MTIEEPAKDLRHAIGRLPFAEAFEPGARKGVGIGLEDPGRAAGLVLIGVRDEWSPLGLLKDEGEGIERPGRTHPRELVGAQIDFGLKMIGVSVAKAAVDTVG